MRAPRTASGTGADAPASRRSAPLAWLWALAVLVLVVALDQLSKHAVETSIVPGEEDKVLPGIQLVDTRNKGVAFGFFPGNHLIVTVLIGLALVVLLAYFARHASRALMWLPTGMIAGGALGNVLDRVRHGSVTDFIKLPLGWPPFNLADSSITLGVLILFVVIDRARARQPAQAPPRPQAERR
ncbi:MAG TPA: signal peptidase II [Solirubrobacteraceae bacterium]|jgi:signal peptidase II|nr:signal peptidase II [Solirubrobacteraceae bacterium]